MGKLSVFVRVCGASAMLLAGTQASVSQSVTNCTCTTPPGNFTAGIGQVVSSNGDVLVDYSNGTNGQVLSVGSEILTGSGSANVSVGLSCNIPVGPNTLLSISQPAGAGGNLCVQTTQIATAPEELASTPVDEPGAPNGAAVLGLVALGGGVAAIAGAESGSGRASASP